MSNYILKENHTSDELQKAVDELTQRMKNAEEVVVFTDLPISEGKTIEECLKSHLSLKKMVEAGKISAVITENVDGLQRLAGLEKD
jgi:NAD-dependent SIR2 family protein deacetylase